MIQTTHSSKAFTLIELLIVVAIIGILAAIAVPNFLNAQVRAKVARVEADQRSISVALESYRLDRNAYPLGLSQVDSQTGLGKLTTPTPYLSSLPPDPFAPVNTDGTALRKNYAYLYVKGGNAAISNDYMMYMGKIQASGESNKIVDVWELRSLGPNGKDDTAIAYNPSNGIASAGDVCRFGP